MLQIHRLDGFQVFTGVTAVVAGPVILATGALPPGWGLLITVSGAIVLWAQWKEGTKHDGGRAGRLHRPRHDDTRRDVRADPPIGVGATAARRPTAGLV